MKSKVYIVLGVMFLIAFGVLLYFGSIINRDTAPIPEKIVDTSGKVIASKDDIIEGQEIFVKSGLKSYGSVLGNGSYLGPDFTTMALKSMYDNMLYFTLKTEKDENKAKNIVKDEIRKNTYSDGILVFSPSKTYALFEFIKELKEFLNSERVRNYITHSLTDTEIEKIAKFLVWTAWMCSTERPGKNYSYSNNWPYFPEIGNIPLPETIIWTSASASILVFGIALVLFLYFRKKLYYEPTGLGYEILTGVDSLVQKASIKLTIIPLFLFLNQVLVGGLLAHYYSDPSGMFLFIPSKDIFPYNAMRPIHIQMAILWIATGWIAGTIYLSSKLAKNNSKFDKLLVDILFLALLIVALGGFLGIWMGIKGFINGTLKIWLGYGGWEYLELGLIWRIGIVVGLVLWIVILIRNFSKVNWSDPEVKKLATLLIVVSLFIPGMYAIGFLSSLKTHISMAEFWRWWVIHIWAEGAFAGFAAIIVALYLVILKLVSIQSAMRVVIFELVMISITSVVGTLHHYYWVGGLPLFGVGIGSVLTTLEMIVIVLLFIEAYEKYTTTKEHSEFKYSSAFKYLIWMNIFHVLGVGVLGLFINFPIMNYYSHGTNLTANHAHAALPGVFGLLSLSLIVFTIRSFSSDEIWKSKLENLINTALWFIVIGLIGMTFFSLLPIGLIQTLEGMYKGYWAARDVDIYINNQTINSLLWFRIVPDFLVIIGSTILFIAGSIAIIDFIKRKVVV